MTAAPAPQGEEEGMRWRQVFAVFVVVSSWIGVGANDAMADDTAWVQTPIGTPAVEAPVGFCSSDPDIMYVGTFGGGVLRSRDHGHTFETFNNGLTNLSVNALVVDPNRCDTVYVATFGGGIFKTTDGGAHWESKGETTAILWMTIDPRHPSTIYTANNGGAGVRKSTDGGDTWFNANGGIAGGAVWNVVVDPENPEVLYAATSSSGGYKSVNGGETWTSMAVDPIVWSLALDPRDSSIVYAGTNGNGVFRSVDKGASFSRLGTPGNGRVLSLALDPHRRGVIYAGLAGEGVWVSTDFGVTFEQTSLTGSLVPAMAIDESGEVYAGTGSDGVFRSHSYGAVWHSVGKTELQALNAQNVYSLAVDPANAARVVASTNDGGLLATSDRGTTWQRLGSGFSSRTSRRVSFDPGDPQRYYAGSFNGGGLFVSTDAGNTWTSRRIGPETAYLWTTHVDSSRAVYVGTVNDGLWRSTDFGTTFVRLGQGTLTDIRSVAVNGSRILASGRLGLFRSVDNGVTWTQIITVYVSNITVDPSNPNTVYAAMQTGGVSVSTDGGATFRAINNGLTSLRTSRGNGVVIDPRRPTTLYIGTEEAGVFKSIDGGATWRSVNQGLTNLIVLALAIDPSNPDIVYAGGGSGVFKTTTGGDPR